LIKISLKGIFSS